MPEKLIFILFVTLADKLTPKIAKLKKKWEKNTFLFWQQRAVTSTVLLILIILFHETGNTTKTSLLHYLENETGI